MSTPNAREFTASTHGELQPTLIVLENLLDALTETTGSAPAVRSTVQAIRAGIGADIAFWHSRHGGKIAVVAGEGPMAAEQLTHVRAKADCLHTKRSGCRPLG